MNKQMWFATGLEALPGRFKKRILPQYGSARTVNSDRNHTSLSGYSSTVSRGIPVPFISRLEKPKGQKKARPLRTGLSKD